MIIQVGLVGLYYASYQGARDYMQLELVPVEVETEEPEPEYVDPATILPEDGKGTFDLSRIHAWCHAILPIIVAIASVVN